MIVPMSNIPTIGVIIPAYQAENHIKKCIQAVISQTYNCWKAIVIDDGSTDKTREIVEEYVKIDSRIELIHQPNSGVASARNRGLERVNGEYIAFIDSDDIIEPEYFETLTYEITKTKADIVCCIGDDNHFFSGESDRAICDQSFIRENFAPMYLNYSFNSVWGKLYKYSAVKNIRFVETMRVAEDLVFNIHCLNNIEKVAFIRSGGYKYNPNTESATHRFDKRDFENQTTVMNEVTYFCRNNSVKSFEDAIQIMYLRNIIDPIINASTYLPLTSAKTVIKELIESEPYRTISAHYSTTDVVEDPRRRFIFDCLKENRVMLILLVGKINYLRNIIKRQKDK